MRFCTPLIRFATPLILGTLLYVGLGTNSPMGAQNAFMHMLLLLPTGLACVVHVVKGVGRRKGKEQADHKCSLAVRRETQCIFIYTASG